MAHSSSLSAPLEISSMKQLPECFDIQKYAECDKLSLVEWHAVLDLRRHMFQNLPSKPVMAHASRVNLVTEVLKNPIFHKGINFRISQAVLAPRLEDLKYRVDKWWAEMNSDDPPMTEYPTRLVPIYINLASSDESIMKGLCELLPELRKSHESFLKSFYGFDLEAIRTRSYDVTTWADMGLLPYIDLRAWERTTNHHITWEVISEATDVNGTGSVERTRKTVAKLADELVFKGHGLAVLERAISDRQ